MKKVRVLFCSMVLVFAFAGAVFAGFEGPFGETHYGTDAGYTITSGNYPGNENTLIGYYAGRAVSFGSGNTFVGSRAGVQNTDGTENTFVGGYAGYSSMGDSNTFVGNSSGLNNRTGNWNTLLGSNSDVAAGIYNATAIGYRAVATQSNSLVLGSLAGGMNGEGTNVGIGTTAPARKLHIAGPDGVVRVDRSQSTTAVMMVRTDTNGAPLKTYLMGTNANGVNNGNFVINDLGASVSGGGVNRLTIANNGTVYVQSLVQTSSKTMKDNVRTFDNALETVKNLRGVRFDWKDSKAPSVGLIAEEVEGVVPEVVAHENGSATGVNYAALVGVLVEAIKEQQQTIQGQQKSISTLSGKVSDLERLLILSNTVSKAD